MTKNDDLARLISKERFAAASRLREKDVEIDGIGVVRIRELTTDQRRTYMEYLEIGEDNKPHFKPEQQVKFNKFVISMGVINGNPANPNEDGGQMFASMQEVPEIRMDVAETLAHEILVLSGIVPDQTLKKTTPNTITPETQIS